MRTRYKKKQKLKNLAKTRVPSKDSGVKLREPHKNMPKYFTAYHKSSEVVTNHLAVLMAENETIKLQMKTRFTTSLKNFEKNGISVNKHVSTKLEQKKNCSKQRPARRPIIIDVFETTR